MSLNTTANKSSLATTRGKIETLAGGGSTQCAIAFAGDSWIQGDSYWLRQFAKALHDKYGFAGLGFVGFQWFGTSSGTWVDGGSQPSGGGAGCARGDLSANPVFNGAWSSDNGNQPGGAATPSIGYATSSTADAYVRFAFPAGHTGADLFYAGDGTGIVQYSWDNGSSWSDDLDLTTTGPANIALADVPSGAGTLRIKVISGNVTLAGVNMKSTADGVVIHKLGASGSNSAMWVAGDLEVWAEQVADLGVDCVAVLLGTNDQSGELAASTFGSRLQSIMSAISDEDSGIERLLIGPAENTGDNTIPMTSYNAAARSAAVSGGFAFYDLNVLWGGDPDDYADGTALDLLNSSGTHPEPTTGGALTSNAMERLIALVHSP